MRGAERFKSILEKNMHRKVLIYGDPDADGLISLLLMCKFCDMVGLTYSYYVNENRYHGFDLPLNTIKGYLIIAADFTITEDEVKTMVDNDIVLLSTDHHEVQSQFIDIVGETAEGIVINNQYPFEPDEDRYLSGAGVFYELICSLYPEFKNKEYEALVGVTLLSDMREIENQKARRYLRTTYTIDSTQGYINYLITNAMGSDTDYSWGVPKLDRNFIDFTLSPTINALLRANKTDEAVNFILGFGLESNNTREIQKQLILDMTERAQVCPFPNIVFLVVNTSDFFDYDVQITSYIGLLCSDYKDKHNNISVLGAVNDNGVIIRASFRGRYDDIHYLSGFRHIDIDAHGHAGAFGIQNFHPVTQTWYDIDDIVQQLEENHVQTVKIFEVKNLGFFINRDGMKIATENCYVRDMYRTYIRYTGSNAKIVRQTYRTEEFTQEDYARGIKPDETVRGKSFKYIRDENGNPIRKYIEYLVDGKKVKSFGVAIEDGIILPILERGYVYLYVRSNITN